MPLKEKGFLPVSLMDCRQSVVCILVFHHHRGNLSTDESLKAEKPAISDASASSLQNTQKNSSEREGNPLEPYAH